MSVQIAAAELSAKATQTLLTTPHSPFHLARSLRCRRVRRRAVIEWDHRVIPDVTILHVVVLRCRSHALLAAVDREVIPNTSRKPNTTYLEAPSHVGTLPLSTLLPPRLERAKRSAISPECPDPTLIS